MSMNPLHDLIIFAICYTTSWTAVCWPAFHGANWEWRVWAGVEGPVEVQRL